MQIIETLKNAVSNDPLVQQFLIELICEESVHKNPWRWKELYKKKLKEYSQRSLEQNEDH